MRGMYSDYYNDNINYITKKKKWEILKEEDNHVYKRKSQIFNM